MIIQLKATDGSIVEFEDSKIIGKGEMKEVYFSPDKSYVVAFYKEKDELVKAQLTERLESIVGKYRRSIFDDVGGRYWEKLFCWPQKIVEYDGRLGLVLPTYEKRFFFRYGSRDNDSGGIKGKEKEGKWFASIRNREFLDERERGNWLNYITMCYLMSQAVKRLNAAGLAHSDLSYKNVLLDPPGSGISIIDLDGLVVTGKFNPEVIGTSDFIAPEVMSTQHLDLTDPKRILPSISTDCHALAVLIYMYLLYRHPLRGGRVLDLDPDMDEDLIMGESALFIEHPTDRSNRVNPNALYESEKFFADPAKVPYTVCGPYLKPLFDRAFISGLHHPEFRPMADEWANALSRTMDLLVPCSGEGCWHEWFVYDPMTKVCPFCGTPIRFNPPIFYFYALGQDNEYRITSSRLVGWGGKPLYIWNVNREMYPVEILSENEREPVAEIVRKSSAWYIRNLTLPDMYDLDNGRVIEPGQHFRLDDGVNFVLSRKDSAEVIVCYFNNSTKAPEKLKMLSGRIAMRKQNEHQSEVETLDRSDIYKKFRSFFESSELQLPSGIVNREYICPVGRIFPTGASLSFAGLDSVGLYYNHSRKAIMGFPEIMGDIRFRVTVSMKKPRTEIVKTGHIQIELPPEQKEAFDGLEEGSQDDMSAIRLPTAQQGSDYHVSMKKLFPNINVVSVGGLEEIGLYFSKRLSILSGKPQKMGTFRFKIRFQPNRAGSSRMLLLSKDATLYVRPDLRSTWNDVPTPKDIKYYKPDNVAKTETLPENMAGTSTREVFAVSARGRIHANNGLPRNADLALSASTGWIAAIISDGSDRAEFSREGTRIASQTAASAVKSGIVKFNDRLNRAFSSYAEAERRSKLFNEPKILSRLLTEFLGPVFQKAYYEIEFAASYEHCSAQDYAATLSIMLYKKFSFGSAVIGASVGQCGMAVCDSSLNFYPLGYDSADDFVFRKAYLTDPGTCTDGELEKRITFRVTGDVMALLLMNNSLTRARLGSIVEQRDSGKWDSTVRDLFSAINLDENEDPKVLEELRKWVNVWSPEHNGDRSIIMMI